MSDFLQTISSQFDREPAMCDCGHPIVLHAEGVGGCMGGVDDDSGNAVCSCETYCRCTDTDRGTDTLGCPFHDDQAAGLGGGAVCLCGHAADEHIRGSGCYAEVGDEFCACRLDSASDAAGRETASMRRARRWLAEMQADAGVSGRKLDGRTAALFRHLTTCAACNLRESNDPEFCEVADGMQDGEA